MPPPNGRIDFGEFLRGMNHIGLNMSIKDATKEFDRIDVNGGGQILFDEFCAWVRKRKIPVD